MDLGSQLKDVIALRLSHFRIYDLKGTAIQAGAPECGLFLNPPLQVVVYLFGGEWPLTTRLVGKQPHNSRSP